VVRKHRHGITASLLNSSLTAVSVFLPSWCIKNVKSAVGAYDTMFLIDAKIADRHSLDRRS